jgi:hypothetical protein
MFTSTQEIEMVVAMADIQAEVEQFSSPAAILL